MADDGFVLEIPEMVGIALSPERTPQAATQPWPEGTLIISADSHMLETDCWVDRFPEHLKEQAPRMEFKDGGYQLSVNGKQMTPPRGRRRPLHLAGVHARLHRRRGAAEGPRHRGRREGADLPAAPVRPVHVRQDDEPARDLRGLQRAHRRGLRGRQGPPVPGDGAQLLGPGRAPRRRSIAARRWAPAA